MEAPISVSYQKSFKELRERILALEITETIVTPNGGCVEQARYVGPDLIDRDDVLAIVNEYLIKFKKGDTIGMR